MSDTRSHPPLFLAWSVWGLGALLYLIGFYQRVAPAVITDQLMLEFTIGGAALGNLSAFYFYSYVAMQVPTGMMADRWGPRRLLTVGAGVAALGTALFAFAPTLFLANMGRLLIGASVAVAFVSMLKLASHWFPPQKYAMVSGMALLMGVVGGVVAGVPLRLVGTASGVCNMGPLLGGMLLQPAVGWLLDRRWNGALANGVRVYDAAAYRGAFTLMFVTMIVAAFVLTLAKDSHARQMHD